MRWKCVQASRDDALQRLGQRQVVRRAALDEEIRELLRIEGVSAGTLEERMLGLASRTGRSRSRARSAAVCSSESGESASVVAFSLPPPQAGRRSRSSGRAVPTTSSGTSASQSTSSSTKSSSVSSAQWRSSNTSTSGRCSDIASSARRHAANATLTPVAAELVSSPRPTRAKRCVRTRPRRRSRESRPSSARASPRLLRPSCSTMPACALTISPSAHSVTPSP